MTKHYPIIALTGPAGSGKDTVADHLSDRYGYTKIAFADALRLEICAAFGVHVDKLLDREGKEVPCKQLSLSRCNDHRFVGLILAKELQMDEASNEIVEAHISQPRSPRWAMQLWGTEYRREVFGEDYWITELAQSLADINGPVVIPDCRFEGEAEFISVHGGEIWKLHRPDLALIATHKSEMPLPRYLIDRDLDNTGDIALLHKQAEHALMMMDRARRGVA
ncbi:MAG: hypothetical protein P4L87_25070 [Formivibrio sp.]|nr:hypothetical protein [Formivibrio sp.]